MKTITIAVLLACAAGCTTHFERDAAPGADEAPASEEPQATETKSERAAPAVVFGVDEAERGAMHTQKGHHWFSVDVPEAADGTLDVSIADAPLNASITLYDEARRPLETGPADGIRAAVTRGHRYFIEARTSPLLDNVRLVSSFEPAFDAFEPNDDAKSAKEIEAGKSTSVRLFAGREKDGYDRDFFAVKTLGKKNVRVQLTHGSEGTWACVDLIANDVPFAGGCSEEDIDVSYRLPAWATEVVVRLSGTNRSAGSALTITPQ